MIVFGKTYLSTGIKILDNSTFCCNVLLVFSIQNLTKSVLLHLTLQNC